MTTITGTDTVTGLSASYSLNVPPVGSAKSVPFGATVAGGSNVAQVKGWYQNWSSLVASIGLAKVYFQGKSNPPPTTVSAANAQTQALASLGIPTILCFEPNYYGTTNDSTWPGGANKPAMGTYAAGNTGTVLGDAFDMVATWNGLKATGLNVYGATMWQECDNFSKYSHEMTADSSAPAPVANQVTYMYYSKYQKLHAAGIPVICSYGGWQQGLYSANQGSTLMPFKTFLRPNDPAYCDSVTIDRYADGYHTLGTTPYSQGPGVVPTSSQRWGYGDLADFAGLPFGWIEAGNSASSATPTEDYMVQYLVSAPYTDPQTGTTYPGDPVNSIQATFQYRMQHGLPSVGFAWYQNNGNTTGQNLILSAPDYRIDLLRRVAATLAA